MRLFVLIALALSAAGCSITGGDAPSAVRFIHAVPGADSLDVFIGGNTAFELVRLHTVTPYETDLDAEQVPVRVRTSVGATELLRFEVELLPDGRQTIIAAGARARVRAIVLDDAAPTARPDSAQVRIVHAAALADSVSAFLIDPAASDTAVAVPIFGFRQNTGFRTAAADLHRLQIALPGGAVVFDEEITFVPGQRVTLVVADATEAGGIVLVRTDD